MGRGVDQWAGRLGVAPTMKSRESSPSGVPARGRSRSLPSAQGAAVAPDGVHVRGSMLQTTFPTASTRALLLKRRVEHHTSPFSHGEGSGPSRFRRRERPRWCHSERPARTRALHLFRSREHTLWTRTRSAQQDSSGYWSPGTLVTTSQLRRDASMSETLRLRHAVAIVHLDHRGDRGGGAVLRDEPTPVRQVVAVVR